MNYWVLFILVQICSAIHTTLVLHEGYIPPGVCERERRVSRHAIETYTEKKRCLYYESCWTRIVQKTRTKVVYDTVKDAHCCEGYIRVSFPLADKLACMPICDIPCVNGECNAPGVCECNEGFTKKDDHICERVCEPECVNADCGPNNTCSCHPGFIEDLTHSCLPHCTNGCVNGYCSQPEVCACEASYTLSPNATVCLPVCTLECENGECVAPDRCECHDKYVESGHSWNLCVPFCTEPCENALCTAPDVCTCFEGYDQQIGNESYKCVPHCSKECINGECIAPEECGCVDGFDMNVETQLCEPVCSDGCENGRCVAPEKCECTDGYLNLIGSCVPHCENECINGNCFAPNECSCYYGTLKASSHHCVQTCDVTQNDECYHESPVVAPSALIRLKDDDPYVDLPIKETLIVPCKHLSTIESGFRKSHYQCYTYLNFEDESLKVVCSLHTETMSATDSLNRKWNLTAWINATSMESLYMNVSFIHRNASSYCSAYLCSDSNRALYLNTVSTIQVCKEQHPDDQKPGWPSWMILSIIGVSLVLLFTLVITAAGRYYSDWRKVSYIVNSRHHSTSSRCGILEATGSCIENELYEHMEAVELSNESDGSPMITDPR